jgi:phosphoglucosamine mutase
MVEAAFVAGLCAEGVDAALAGVLPTPAVAQLAHARNAPAAMITASHNEFSDNGIKLFAPGGRKLAEDLERRIEHEVRELATTIPSGPEGRGVGVASELRGALDEYVAHVLGAMEDRRLGGIRVVVDCANGAAFRAAPRVLRELGAHVEVLHAAPNGTNINQASGSTDPADLQRAVIAAGADAGLAFDGDADRLIAVDEEGHIVDGDQLLAIAAFDLKERGALRHDKIVATVMSNIGLRRCLAAEGIEIVEVPVGDRHVLDALARHDLALGGEQSGHLVFPDLSTTGDGILTGALLLDVIEGTGQRLSRLAGVVTKLPQVLRNVRVADKRRLDADSGFWAAARAAQAELGDAGRVLVRPSGTEALVRVMVEAPTIAEADAIAGHLAAAVEAACGIPE